MHIVPSHRGLDISPSRIGTCSERSLQVVLKELGKSFQKRPHGDLIVDSLERHLRHITDPGPSDSPYVTPLSPIQPLQKACYHLLEQGTVMSNGGQKRKSSSCKQFTRTRSTSADQADQRVTDFHFLAGLSSGVTTAFLLQPADLLKTRVQQSGASSLTVALKKILNGPNPIRSLWRGTTPSVIRTGAGSALYFGMLNNMRQYAARTALTVAVAGDGIVPAAKHSSSLPKLSNTANLATGALARATAGFIMSPVTVLKVRYESSYYSYTSLVGAARDIASKEGLKGFFAGFGATAVRDAPYAGLYVLFYEQSKAKLSEWSTALKADTSGTGFVAASFTSAPINFVSGMVAAISATGATNPFDAIKTRLQLMPNKYTNMVQAAKLMLKEEGVRSLFDGLGLRMGRKALSSALAWTVYEEMIRRAEEKLPV